MDVSTFVLFESAYIILKVAHIVGCMILIQRLHKSRSKKLIESQKK